MLQPQARSKARSNEDPMKIIYTLAFFFCAVVSYAQADQSDVKLDSVVPAKLAAGVRKYIFTHTNQWRPYIKRKVNGIEFTIAFSESSRKIVYVNTEDEKFKTQSGLRIGDWIEIKKEDFYVIPQREIRGPATLDGWEPVVGYDVEAIDRKPNLVDKLQPGETITLRILRFSKGGN